jgi:hypothetical protein
MKQESKKTGQAHAESSFEQPIQRGLQKAGQFNEDEDEEVEEVVSDCFVPLSYAWSYTGSFTLLSVTYHLLDQCVCFITYTCIHWILQRYLKSHMFSSFLIWYKSSLSKEIRV